MPRRCSGNTAEELPTCPYATWDWMERTATTGSNPDTRAPPGGSGGRRSVVRLTGELHVGPGLPERPFGADVPRRAQQQREMVLQQPLRRRLRGVHRDVHGGAHRPGAVPDRDGDRPHTRRELLVG